MKATISSTVCAPAAEASPSFHEKVVQLNLVAPLHVAQRAYATMRRQGGGVIVNVGSVAAHRASPQVAAYAAARLHPDAQPRVFGLENEAARVFECLHAEEDQIGSTNILDKEEGNQ